MSEIDQDFADHLKSVAMAIVDGDVVPVLGAGANLCDRKQGETWVPGTNLPSGGELSLQLAERFACKITDLEDLVRVSQWAAVTVGEGSLVKKLRTIFAQDYEITSLHHFLAELPAIVGAAPPDMPAELIVTTNYDDLMERALTEQGVPFDVVRYAAQGPNRGHFIHQPPEGEPVVITSPNSYRAVDPDVQTVVLKIHGTVDRVSRDGDSYVITEDHYIEFLEQTNPSELFPVHVLAKLMNSNFLFLGYGMRDWNLRVILRRILEARQGLDWTSWAVQQKIDALDKKLWSTRKVELHQHSLTEYVTGLRAALHDVVG